METRYNDLIVEMACQLIAPFIVIFGFYVIFHGHYSPGGGFQGGAIVAALAILLRLSLGVEHSGRVFSPRLAMLLAGIGMLIFAGVGVASMIGGGSFLDYGSIVSRDVPQASMHYIGILIAEIGIAISVFGVLLSIFDALLGGDSAI